MEVFTVVQIGVFEQIINGGLECIPHDQDRCILMSCTVSQGMKRRYLPS